MKKLFLLSTVLCAVLTAQAQVISSYTMQATQGIYTEITDGVAMDTTGIALDEMQYKVWHADGLATETTTMTGFPIGFDFEFNDILCNQFVIGSDGYIALGRDAITIDPTHGPFVAVREEAADNVIGVMPNVWTQMRWETTSFSYKLEGEAPNRTLVVQFKDWAPQFGWDGADVSMNFQIRLHETTNLIDIVFGEFSNTGDMGKNTRIALRGNYEDLLSLTDGEEAGMINFVALPDDNSFFLENGMITSGLTYTFTPPADCVTPVEEVPWLSLETTSTGMTMEFTPTADADHYLVLLSLDGTETVNPTNGVRYAAGDSLGDFLVWGYTADTMLTTEYFVDLQPATRYNVTIYPANSKCSGGPLYRNGFQRAAIDTKPGSPASIEVTATTLNTLTFNVEGNGTDNVIVLVTDSVRDNAPYAPIMEFGEPIGPLAVGDVIADMSRVVYMGPSAQGVVVEDLEPGVAYYVRALSYNDYYDYSSDYVQEAVATVATLPFTPDLSYRTELNMVPVGWESETWGKAKQTSGYGDDEYQFYGASTANATDGFVADLTTSRILVDQKDVFFTFEYCMYIWQRFGGNQTYDAWEAGDKLAVQVSLNGGDFEDVHVITAENNVKVDSVNQFIPVSVDLSAYQGDEVRIRIHWECFSGSQVRVPIEDLVVEGVPLPAVPVVSVSDITWNSAVVTWRGEQESYEFAYAKVGEEFTTNVVNEKSVALTELTHLTEYQVKVRGIVSEEETSEWSDVVTFTTKDLPECPVPTGLVHADTDDYGDRLYWEIDEEHLSWDLRYRESTATTWTDIEGLETNEYLLYDLVPGAAYLWRVRAHCDMERVSNYASQETFNANGQSAISAATADRLNVVAGNGSITIYNSDVYVESVSLLDVQGRVLGNYAINARDNVTIPTNATGVALVVVNTVDKQFVYKVSVK